MQIGFIGLGKMGSRMASKLLEEGHSVTAWNRSKETISNFKFQTCLPAGKISNSTFHSNFTAAETIGSLAKSLIVPRIVWVMLPAGDVTESILQETAGYLSPGDILIDGGNSNFQDTQRRFEEFAGKGIRFLGIGVSGGIKARDNGYPLMVGGDRSAYEYIAPILKSLALPHGGYAYFGTGGAGHFVKMVHNGIEYGMMQSLGEGFGILEKSPYNLDLVAVAGLWQKGTIVSGFLLDRAADALSKNPDLSDILGEIAATGEAEWTVAQGKKEQVPVEVIERSLDFRKRSVDDTSISTSFAARLVAALRQEFGGHAIKKV